MTLPNKVTTGPGRSMKAVSEGESDRIVGYIETHPRKGDPERECRGFLYIDAEAAKKADMGRTGDNAHPVWEVKQEDPLTLTPSIECLECGNHGYVTAGKWVPA
jgi:hypothetical protein